MNALTARKVSGTDDMVGPADYYFAHLVPLHRSLIINCPKCRQAQTPPKRVAAYERITNLWRYMTSFGKSGKRLTLEAMICRYCLHSFSVEDGNVHLSNGPVE